MTYDPLLFKVQLATVIPAKLGTFRLGASRLGKYVAGWVSVPLATFTYSFDYTPDVNNTLIIGSETASISISFKHDISSAQAPLFPSDRVRVLYNNVVKFSGTVDATTITRTPVDSSYGYTVRTDFTASLVGTYAAALSREVTYGKLPAETALKRIQRWVKVTNWNSTIYNPKVNGN